jgi:alkylation response protein AidB-like acyl-CoA dehydrogenase
MAAVALAALPRVVDLLAARAEEHDREAGFPYHGVELVHEAGLGRLTVGERYGGPGAGLAETVRLLGELGRGDPSVALLTAATLLVHAGQVRGGGWADEAYRALLAGAAEDPAPLGALAAAGPLPVARRAGEGWRLTGRLRCVLGAEALSFLAVRAATPEAAEDEAVFLVPADAPGVTAEPAWDGVGLRAAAAHDVLLAEVEVPEEGAAFPDAARRRAAAAWRQLAVASVFLGVARAAGGWAARHHELPPQARGETEVALAGAEDLLLGLAHRVDDGDQAAPLRAPGAALLATRAAASTVSRLTSLTLPDALTRAHPLERHHRDVLCARLYLPPEAEVLAAAGGAKGLSDK